MRNRFIAPIALLLAVASLSYTGWLHQHSKRFAEQALKERETTFVRANAPRLRGVYRDMLGDGGRFDPSKFDPQTLEEMFYPFMMMFQRMQDGAPDGVDNPAK